MIFSHTLAPENKCNICFVGKPLAPGPWMTTHGIMGFPLQALLGPDTPAPSNALSNLSNAALLLPLFIFQTKSEFTVEFSVSDHQGVSVP